MTEITRPEVNSLILNATEAWNRGDIHAFCAAYVIDAELISKDTYCANRVEILEHYRPSFEASQMPKLTVEVLKIRSDTKSAVVFWTLESESGISRGCSLLTLTFYEGRLRIAQDASAEFSNM